MFYIIHTFAEMMPAEASLKDLRSLAWFKSKLSWNHITNNADKTKEFGNFKVHKQFFEKIGSEYIVEAVRMETDSTGARPRRRRTPRNNWNKS